MKLKGSVLIYCRACSQMIWMAFMKTQHKNICTEDKDFTMTHLKTKCLQTRYQHFDTLTL